MSFAEFGTSISQVPTRDEVISWRQSELTINATEKDFGLARGWTISAHHRLDPTDPSTLHKGDGSVLKNTASVIKTYAGNGETDWALDGADAFETSVSHPVSAVIDSAEDLYVVCQVHSAVLKIRRDGIVEVVAGGATGFSDDDGIDAGNARLRGPMDLALDSRGNLYIAEMDACRIRKIDSKGIITTVAGNGDCEYSGDGGPALQAGIRPTSVAVDDVGNIYFTEAGFCVGGEVDPVTGECIGGEVIDSSFRVRKVSTNGYITTVAGIGERYDSEIHGDIGDGVPAGEAALVNPRSLSIDARGNIYLADGQFIRKVNTSGIITTVAGNGYFGYMGDGGLATDAQIPLASAVTCDRDGTIYFSQHFDNGDVVRKVNGDGYISTVVGRGEPGYSGDNGPAAHALLYQPGRIAMDPDGFLYIPDKENHRIRKVSTAGYTGREIHFAEASGLGHTMSADGRHLDTYDLETGVVLLDFAYDDAQRLVSITDAFGNETVIERSSDGTPLAILSPYGLRTELNLDGNDQLTRITYPDNQAFNFAYDGNDGLLTAKTEPNGNRFNHQFDADGRLIRAVDEEGGNWDFDKIYYASGDSQTEVVTGEGNITTYLDHAFSTGAFSSTITNAVGEETYYGRSADGLYVTKDLPCGMWLSFDYDLDPEYQFKYVTGITERAPSGLEKVVAKRKTYEDTNEDDVPDLIIDTITDNGKVFTHENNVLQATKTTTTPEGRVVTTTYHPDTLLTTAVSIPDLYDTAYGYDTRGRLTSVTNNTRQTSFTYNAQGFLGSVTDPRNHTTTYAYDPVGRVTEVSRPDGSSLGFTYDPNGNMTVLSVPIAVDHTFGYNKVNRKNAYHAPLSGTYRYVYDKDRRLISTVFPSGQEINNIYDKTRLVRIETPEGNIDQTYLCATKVESITNGVDTITYGYDGKLVTSETLSGTLNQTLSYAYDNDFNPAGFTYAGGSESYAYDQDGLLTGAGDYTITRNAQNGLPEGVNGGALSISRTHNGYGEIETESHSVNNQPLAAWNLTRNQNGGITEKGETVDGVASSYAYTYDPMGRLLTVTKDGAPVQEYRYDPNGVRIYEMNAQRGIAERYFTYSDEDHLLSAGETTYLYDYDGFLVSKTDGSDVTQFDYSTRGELKSVTSPNGTIIEYVHDPLGRRVAKKVNGTVVEKYLWQGLTRLLAVYDGGDNLLMRFEYADGRMPVAMTRSDGTYYLAYDQVGSLRIVADISGNVVKQIEYDPFGNITMDTDPAFRVPFGFAGGLYDRDTGLVRFGYRDFDPDVGRWTAKDPIFFAGGDTDLYGYCLNDPVNWVDPTGEFAFVPVIALILKGAAIMEGVNFFQKKYYEMQIYKELERKRRYLERQLEGTNACNLERRKILIDALKKTVLQQAKLAHSMGVDLMSEFTDRTMNIHSPKN